MPTRKSEQQRKGVPAYMTFEWVLGLATRQEQPRRVNTRGKVLGKAEREEKERRNSAPDRKHFFEIEIEVVFVT